MSLDFSGQFLVGRSFARQDLTGANFSTADIRSADFTQANLTDASFHSAKGGLSKPWQLLQILLLLVCSGTVGVMSVVAGTFSSTFLIQENIDAFTIIPGLLSLLCFASISLPLMIQGFTPSAFQTVLITGTLSIVGITAGTLGATATGSADAAGGLTGALVLLIADTVTLTIAGLTGGPLLIAVCLGCSVAIAIISHPHIYPVAIAGITASPAGPFNLIGMVIIIATVLLASTYIACRVLARDEKFSLIQKAATTFTALGGTRFHQATLTNTCFDQANLKCTRFNQAKIKGTSFYHASNLHTAQLASTILSHTHVRHLAIYRNGSGQNYTQLNLQGINLTQANLSAANFTGSNLSQANLTGTDLTGANLTHVQAIGTQFQQSQLTGTCLQAWNIDSTTQLTDVSCEYVYLQNAQQERRPSSGQFKPGEFTKLFQEIIDTVDLIFQGGIDWQALHTMLASANQQQLLNTPHSQPLSLRSIENKNDGVVVVRIDAPPKANKADLHQQLNQHYQTALHSLETQYQQQLQAKEEQIAMYREHQADLSAIARSLASRPVHLPNPPAKPAEPNPSTTKLITLKIHTSHSFDTPSPVTLQIGQEGQLPFIDCVGTLPSAHTLLQHYNSWQTSYRDYLTVNTRQAAISNSRICTPPAQITNISLQTFQQALHHHTTNLQHSFHQWLAASSFRPLKETILENLNPADTVRLVLQTDTPQLWQLPWQSWDLLNRHPNAELTFSTHWHQSRLPSSAQLSKEPNSPIKILAILGDADGLDINTDCQLLQQLPSTQITVLTEPSRETLNNHLWEKSWDILFFAGHSNSSQGEGYLRLNASDSLSLNDISYGIRKACQQGLQLAIFNSCDGLGLAQHLTDLSLPHMIVMREPIPDLVAQSFLKGLLSAFSAGQPLPQAVREAREKLQGLEDRFPCATWLPVLCQTTTTPSLTWQQLRLKNVTTAPLFSK